MSMTHCSRRLAWLTGVLVAVLVAAACSERDPDDAVVVPIGDGPTVAPADPVVRDDPRLPEIGSNEAVPIFEDLRSARFSDPTTIDNTLFPLAPGTRTVLDGTSIEEGFRLAHRIEFVVTDLTKEILGVETVAVWIEDYSDDELVEAELAFYAQSDDGNVWFFGEYPEEYDDEHLVDAPTWIAGVDGARAGIAMYADPSAASTAYFQGWGPGVDWSDYGVVDSVGEEDCVVLDCFSEVVTIAESSLDESAFQLKSYAPGVGTIRVSFRGDDLNQEMLELVAQDTLTPVELERYEAAAMALETHAYAISPSVYGTTPPLEKATAG